MAAKFPSAACKIILTVVAVAMIGLLFSLSSGAGEEAVTTAAQAQQELPQCNPLVGPPYVSPDCDTWCWNQRHPGGYVKGDVCCCNSGSGGVAAES